VLPVASLALRLAVIGRLAGPPDHAAASRTCAMMSSRAIAAAIFARQHGGEIARHEGDFRVRLGARRIVGRDCVAAAIVHQEARRIEFRHVGGELRRRQREVRRDADERALAHEFTITGANGSRHADHMARGVRFAGGRKPVGLARDLSGAFAAQRAAQRRLDALGQGGEIRLAVERDIDRTAHQRGAAQRGQDGTGKPLNGNAAAVDDRWRRAVDKQWRLIAEINRLCRCPQTIWIAPLALIQAPCPLRSLLRIEARQSHPNVFTARATTITRRRRRVNVAARHP